MWETFSLSSGTRMCLRDVGQLSSHLFMASQRFCTVSSAGMRDVNIFKDFLLACCDKVSCFAFDIMAAILSIACSLTLLGFNAYFLINIQACLLTSTCTSRSPITSYGFLQRLPGFSGYTNTDIKRLLFWIEIGLGSAILVLTFINLVLACTIMKKKKK